MVARELVFLGKFRTDANRGGGFVYSFLAKGSKPVKKGTFPSVTLS